MVHDQKRNLLNQTMLRDLFVFLLQLLILPLL